MPLKSDAENTPIVLDIGEVYTKVGISGDTEPRVIIPTVIPEQGCLIYMKFNLCLVFSLLIEY